MSDGTADVSRRGFLRAAAGGAAGSAAVGTAAAQENGTSQGTETGGGGGGGSSAPDYGGWFSNVSNYTGSTTNVRGQSEVTVEVGASGNGGNTAFAPPAIHVDVGTTVVFEWTGEGGVHNVIEDGGGYDSGSPVQSAGVHFEHTYEEAGISKYYCSPHEGQGMKGAVVVGDQYPTVEPATASGPQVPAAAKSVGVAATAVMLTTLSMAWLFIKFGGDFGQDEE